MPDILLQDVMDNIFPEFWSEKKHEIKETSKKELAEYMFAAGAGIMINYIVEVEKEQNKENDSGKE